MPSPGTRVRGTLTSECSDQDCRKSNRGDKFMTLSTILIIILVVLLLGGFSGRFGGRGYGFGNNGIGLIGVVLIILVVLALSGRL